MKITTSFVVRTGISLACALLLSPRPAAAEELPEKPRPVLKPEQPVGTEKTSYEGVNKRPWSAAQATGAADTPNTGDFSTAWAAREPNRGDEWLALHFDKPVDVERVAIYETYNPGAITKVTARDGQQQEITLAENAQGIRSEKETVPLEIQAKPGVTSGDVTLHLNTALVPGWNEIDAVRLFGRDGTSQWAVDASASSSYGDQCPALRRTGAGELAKRAGKTQCISCHASGVKEVVLQTAKGELVLDIDQLDGRARNLDLDLQRIITRSTAIGADGVDIHVTGPWSQQRALLGVQIADHVPESDAKEGKGPDGALITELLPGFPAEAAGLKKGDVIVRVNGITVASATALRETIGTLEPNSIVVIAYERGGSEAVVTAKLAPPPETTSITITGKGNAGAPPWSPQQACGAPDTPQLGDFRTAWAPASMNGGAEWLRLEYDRAVPVSKVVIHQSCTPGAVSRVTAQTASGNALLREAYLDPWQGMAGRTNQPVLLEVRPEQPGVVSKTITVELDTTKASGWNEIDAVELIGEDGSRQWASRATASSYFGQPGGAAFRKAESTAELEKRLAEVTERLKALEERMQRISRNPNRPIPFVIPRTEPLRYQVVPLESGHHWSAEQACGAPNTPKVGDFPTAWAPAEADKGEEWLQVTFEKPVDGAQLNIYESCGDGAVRRLTAFVPVEKAESSQQGRANTAGENAEKEEGLKEIPVCDVTDAPRAQDGADVPVKTVEIPAGIHAAVYRIYLDTKAVAGWNEIDAVELVGRDGSKQWASAARASSSYYDKYKGVPDAVEQPALKFQRR